MIRFTLENCQAIKHATIEFNEPSIVEFIGNNSNGKSVISKCIDALTSGSISNKETRNSIIRDGAEFAEFTIEHDKKMLGMVLYPEISKSVVVFQPNTDDSEKMTIRGVGDRQGCAELIRKFGFRVYAQGAVCLQLSPTFGAIPFITTGGAVDFEIVDDVTVDKVADEFLKACKEITFPVFRERNAKYKARLSFLEEVLGTQVYPHWREDRKFHDEYIGLYRVMEHMSTMELIDITRPPYFDTVPYLTLITQSLAVPEVKPMHGVQSLSEEITTLNNYNNATCPTCGKNLLEE